MTLYNYLDAVNIFIWTAKFVKLDRIWNKYYCDFSGGVDLCVDFGTGFWGVTQEEGFYV